MKRLPTMIATGKKLVFPIYLSIAGLYLFSLAAPDLNRLTAAPNPPTPIDICSQHAPKCPLTEANWPEANDDWQQTAKRWQRLSFSKPGKEVIWEWSAPYLGSNPIYSGQRENHYTDYSSAPSLSPSFQREGYTYDWERWSFTTGNQRFHQYGGPSEAATGKIGETNCTEGVFFPVIDETVDYVYTPMAADHLEGSCAPGGYIVTYRTTLWGAPQSLERLRRCDEAGQGIPPAESLRGNLVCKTSPHAGTVNQRYVINAPTKDPVVGCEIVLYAWGWTEPTSASGGQDYERWFRNGELRFSPWINIGLKAGQIPSPTDHAWWASRCEPAWQSTFNVAYSGIFKIGDEVYTDTIATTFQPIFTVPTAGGAFTATAASNVFLFAADTFTGSVRLTQTSPAVTGTTPTQDPIKAAIDIDLRQAASNAPVVPQKPFTLIVVYDDAGLLDEDSVTLYRWTGSLWIPETAVVRDLANNTLTVELQTGQGRWAVMSSSQKVMLPFIQR